MPRSYRLTKRAEQSLVDIALWTIENFGLRQADIYEAKLVELCESIVRGHVLARDCSALVKEAVELETPLMFTRAGEHFIVFLEVDDEVIIVDFLHGRSDLPKHIAALDTLSND